MDVSQKNLQDQIPNKGIYWGESNAWQWRNLICHWRVLGLNKKRPLVLVHGFGASSSHWRNNTEAFVQAGFCVYSLDLIGFGSSSQPNISKVKRLENNFWAHQLQAFLEEIVQAEKYGPAILIGNSLGSLVSLTALVARPDLVKAIIAAPLPDPAFVESERIKVLFPKAIKSIGSFLINLFFRLLPLELLIALITKTKLINLALQAAYFRRINADEELLSLVSRPACRKSAAGSLRAMCIGMALREDKIKGPYLLDSLDKKQDRSPILLIWGRQDKLVPLELGQKLKRKHPWLEIEVIDACGHCPHDELPNAFNQVVLNWLRKKLI